jgi:outer membrane receptor for Fe3+-dicitrate
MTRTWKLLGIGALLAVFAVPGPSRADEEDKDQPRSEVQTLKDELRVVKEELATLRRLGETKSRLDALEMRLLHERLDRLEKAVNRLAPGVTTRTASSFTPSDGLTTGTVRLDNRLAVTATVTVNGVPYSVAPFSTRTLRNIPTGAIVYEVTADGFGIRPPVRTPLASNERLTLTVY